MYEHVSVVGERGQITLSKTIREKMGLKKNDRVIFKSEGGKILITKA